MTAPLMPIWCAPGSILAICVPLLACGAPVPQNVSLGVSPERFAQAQRICLQTMKFSQGTAQFDACTESLSEAARKLDGERPTK